MAKAGCGAGMKEVGPWERQDDPKAWDVGSANGPLGQLCSALSFKALPSGGPFLPAAWAGCTLPLRSHRSAGGERPLEAFILAKGW